MTEDTITQLTDILDRLEARYGEQAPDWPTDPYHFLVWWHCGYPASDERCAKGWESLNADVGVSPDRLLSVPSTKLARALKSGGMVPDLRAARLKAIAARVQDEFGGDLLTALHKLPLAKARASFKRSPGM